MEEQHLLISSLHSTSGQKSHYTFIVECFGRLWSVVNLDVSLPQNFISLELSINYTVILERSATARDARWRFIANITSGRCHERIDSILFLEAGITFLSYRVFFLTLESLG